MIHLKQHEDQCGERFRTIGASNEHKPVVYKTKERDLNNFSDIRPQEYLIITPQGLSQNAPRLNPDSNPAGSEIMECQYSPNYCLPVLKKPSHLKQQTRSHTWWSGLVCFKCSK